MKITMASTLSELALELASTGSPTLTVGGPCAGTGDRYTASMFLRTGGFWFGYGRNEADAIEDALRQLRRR